MFRFLSFDWDIIIQHVLIGMLLSSLLNEALQSHNISVLGINRGESNISSCMYCVIMTQKLWSSSAGSSCYLRHSYIFGKINRFEKNVFSTKKGRIWMTQLIYVQLLSWLVLNRVKLNKLCNFSYCLIGNIARWIYRLQLTFLSTSAAMQKIFWKENYLFIVSDCSNLLNKKIKKIINKQNCFYNTASLR